MADRIISYQDQKDKLNQYHGTEININDGYITDYNESVKDGIGDANNRYCAAWGYPNGSDGVKEALYAVADALEQLASEEGHSSVSSYTTIIRNCADACKMEYNRGE